MGDEEQSDKQPSTTAESQEDLVTEEQVVAAYKNGDPGAHEMHDKLFGEWQKGCGESLGGRAMLGKMQINFYLKLGNLDEALQTADDMLTMLENEAPEEAADLAKTFNDLGEAIYQTQQSQNGG